MRQKLYFIFTLLCVLAGMTNPVWADSKFKVENTSGTSKFVITRTTNTSTTETVYYRTVSLSAIAGQHFTDKYGSLDFDAEHNSREVEVTENTPNADAYKYQTAINRKYRLEVVDPGGFYLAHCDRTISNGLTQFEDSYVNKSITDLVYFQSGSVKSGSGNKYLDVAHSGTNGTEKKIDDGYDYDDNTLCTVSTGTLYNNSTALRTWLNSLSYKMYATVYFQQREEDDGYQYIQILTDNASTYDGKDGDGKIDNGPTTSLYKAAFILTKTEDHLNSWKYQAFPHKTDNNTSSTEFDYSDSYLYAQKFKSTSDRATTSGSLILEPTVNNINVRFDANGSGDDTWYLKNLKVRLALVDTKAPTASGSVKVNGGRHSKGNTFYISVPFDEIVKKSGTLTLSTTWGDLSYFDGSGSNVLTFSGTISDDASGALSIKSYSGTITDLAGNNLSDGISGTNLLNSSALEGNYSYAITYNLDGGSVETANPTSFNYMTATITLNNPTKTGYTFAGWTGSNGSTPNPFTTIAQHSHGDKSFTANWTPNQYTVMFDMQGGDGGSESTTATYYAAMTAVTPPTRSGYTFGGYYAETNGGGTQYYYADGTSASNWNLADAATLYAQWTANTYNVHFDANATNGIGATGSMDDQTFTYDAAQSLTANAFTRTGYTFAGWNTAADGTGTAYNDQHTTPNVIGEDGATATLYAQWRAVDWEGEGSLESPYLIIYPSQLLKLADDVNGGNEYNGTYFRLDDDINMGGVAFGGIGYKSNSEDRPFRGCFDGDYKTISNLTISYDGSDRSVGFIGYAYVGTSVKNLTVCNASVSAPNSTYAGIVVGYVLGYTEIENCLIVNSSVVGSQSNSTGVFFGYQNYTAIDLTNNHYLNCTRTTGGTTSTTDIGIGGHFQVAAGDVAGISSLHTLTLPANITATSETVTYDNVTYIAAGTTVTLNTSLGTFHTVTYSDGSNHNADVNINGSATFLMPASDATVSATFNVPYIDADGQEQTCYNATAIQSGDFQILGSTSNDEAWYVVSGEVIANGCLEIKDKSVHLVLCDGATLSATSASDGIRCGYGSLTIYTQSEDTGSLIATSNTYNRGIYVNNDLTINGGNINATGGQYGIYSTLGSITLGWTHVTDRITASSYCAGGTIGVKTGQALTDGSAVYSGTVNRSDIDGKTLRPDLWNVADGNDGSTAETAYTITTTSGLDQLAAFVNEGNSFNGKFFRLGNDITYSHTTDWNDANSTENNYTTISNSYNTRFRGTFDGQGHTVSGIRIYKGNDNYQGLFGYTSGATIRNVNLADARITGKQIVGGIAGYITENNAQGGIVENCRVGSDVIIHAVADNAKYHGGVVGDNNGGTIRGCVSAANLTVANGLTDIGIYGGIVGNINGDMSDCLAIGATVPAVTKNGAIAGYVNDGGGYTHTNNYYRDCTVGANAHQSDAYTVSAGTDVTMALAGSADLTYPYNGIQRYGSALRYNGELYAPQGANVSLTLNTTVPAESFAQYGATAGTISGSENPYTLTMPAKDATVIAHLKIPYIDENGDEQICSDYTLLQSGDEEVNYGTWGQTHWYVVNGDVIINGKLNFNDSHSHLIVCDGAHLTVNSSYTIPFEVRNITIYGQSQQSGTLTVNGNNEHSSYGGIHAVANIIINGCIVTVTAGCGIEASDDITINRGTVNATGTNNRGISGYNVTINGGIVNATGTNDNWKAGIFAYQTMTLGWTNPEDRIYASSMNLDFKYNTGIAIKVKDGQTLFNGSEILSGTIYDYNNGNPDVDLAKVNGKTLGPDLWGVVGGNDGSTAEKAYTITTTSGLDQLAAYVNEGNGFSGKFFRLGDDITYSHDGLGDTESNYTAIGGRINDSNKCFRGTFDGQGHTVSGIRIYKSGGGDANGYQGLFGYTSDATVKNVILADARITGWQCVSGIVGKILSSTVENCRVGSDVILHAVADNAKYHGGVVGDNNGGTIRGCVSAATLTVADGLTDIGIYGGIVGYLGGYMSDCLATGANVPAVDNNGAIAGYVYDGGGYTYTNNYYRDCTVGANTHQTDAYTVSAGTNVTLAPAGNADATYDYNGIQRYGSALCYDGVLYAPAAADVSLTLNNTAPAESFAQYAATAGTISGSENPYTLTMAAKDATVIAKLKVPYIDENGVEQICSDYTLIQSSDEEYNNYGTNGQTHWYVVNGDITINGALIFDDSRVHLIVCDGAHLTVSCSEDEAIEADIHLTIYGQSQQSGTITAISGNDSDDYGIMAYGNLIINGCTVSATGGYAIDGENSFIMNRGTVNAVGTYRYGICGDDIIINGGIVNATGANDSRAGLFAYKTMTLGWTKPTDRITASSYGLYEDRGEIIKVKDGQALYNGSEILSGILYDYNNGNPIGDLTKLNGKTLMPALALADNADNSSAIAANNGSTLTLQLSGRTLYHDGYWNTLCLPFDVDDFEDTPLEGADVRTLDNADLTDGVLTLNFTTEGDVTTIEAGKPYIVKWNSTGDNLVNPVFKDVTVMSGTNDQTCDFGDGKSIAFRGTYAKQEYTAEDRSILFLGAANTLYYPQPSGNTNPSIGAFRSYFQLTGIAAGDEANSVRTFVLNFDGEDTQTAIRHTDVTKETDTWYTTGGMRLEGKPTKRGLYIHGGSKVVIP